jgi:hypothetical protein
MVATEVAGKIRAGLRAGEIAEAALRSTPVVHVPILNAETEVIEFLMTTDWRIPTSRHGQFRALVEYLRFGGELALSPNVLISRAETATLRQLMSGMQP